MAGRHQLISKQKTCAVFFGSWILWLAILLTAYLAAVRNHLKLPYLDDTRQKHSGFAASALGTFIVLWGLSYGLLKPSETRECCTLEKPAGFQTFLASFFLTGLGAAYLYIEQPKLENKIPDLPRYALGLTAIALLPAILSVISWIVCCVPRRFPERAEGQREGEMDRVDLVDAGAPSA